MGHIQDQTKELGEIAMELISDHPLYASTCGISYEEAIGVARVIFGSDLRAVKAEFERLDNLSPEELEAEIKADQLAAAGGK